MAQKRLLFDDSESETEDSPSSANGHVEANSQASLRVNEEFAKRFDHNKKREELHRLEEKYGKISINSRRSQSTSGSESDDSSSSEEEDEQGDLFTNAIDSEISATLAAIKNKDPRVYNPDEVFFSHSGNEAPDATNRRGESMTLKQYHQSNILSGYIGEDNADTSSVNDHTKSYNREQEDWKRDILAAVSKAIAEDEMDTDGLFQRKEKEDSGQANSTEELESNAPILPTNPEADPDGYLNAFFSARAWVPKGTAKESAFESDDSEDEQAASDFENAYNMRFEDPSLAARAVITTHARDVASKLTLRREEKSKRKKDRDAKKEKKEKLLSTQKAEQKRLRKLKIEELEKKFNMVKEAGGFGSDKSHGDGNDLDDKWVALLEQEWNGDDDWDTNMARFFGSEYYSRAEDGSGKKILKPTWDDDIDIRDIVPDFEEADDKETSMAVEDFEMQPSGSAAGIPEREAAEEFEYENDDVSTKPSTKKAKQKPTNFKLRSIESFVDDHIKVMSLRNSSRNPSNFRYRAVSPNSFHLSPSDILFASDKQLNEYAGLKKLASFRDEKKKSRDMRRYAKGNKYKLREWRKLVFPDGIPDDPTSSATAADVDTNVEHQADASGRILESNGGLAEATDGNNNIKDRNSSGKRAKKRRRKTKTDTTV